MLLTSSGPRTWGLAGRAGAKVVVLLPLDIVSERIAAERTPPMPRAVLPKKVRRFMVVWTVSQPGYSTRQSLDPMGPKHWTNGKNRTDGTNGVNRGVLPRGYALPFPDRGKGGNAFFERPEIF